MTEQWSNDFDSALTGNVWTADTESQPPILPALPPTLTLPATSTPASFSSFSSNTPVVTSVGNEWGSDVWAEGNEPEQIKKTHHTLSETKPVNASWTAPKRSITPPTTPYVAERTEKSIQSPVSTPSNWGNAHLKDDALVADPADVWGSVKGTLPVSVKASDDAPEISSARGLSEAKTTIGEDRSQRDDDRREVSSSATIKLAPFETIMQPIQSADGIVSSPSRTTSTTSKHVDPNIDDWKIAAPPSSSSTRDDNLMGSKMDLDFFETLSQGRGPTASTRSSGTLQPSHSSSSFSLAGFDAVFGSTPVSSTKNGPKWSTGATKIFECDVGGENKITSSQISSVSPRVTPTSSPSVTRKLSNTSHALNIPHIPISSKPSTLHSSIMTPLSSSPLPSSSIATVSRQDAAILEKLDPKLRQLVDSLPDLKFLKLSGLALPRF